MELTRQQIAKINSYLPLYIYDYEIIKRQISKLRKCLPANTEIFYSAKANPNVAILKTMNNFGLGLEIISEGEFLAGRKAGFKPGKILFGGSRYFIREKGGHGILPVGVDLSVSLGEGQFMIVAENLNRLYDLHSKFNNKPEKVNLFRLK